MVGTKTSGRPGGNPDIAKYAATKLYKVPAVVYAIKIHPDVKSRLKKIGADKIRAVLEELAGDA